LAPLSVALARGAGTVAGMGMAVVASVVSIRICSSPAGKWARQEHGPVVSHGAAPEICGWKNKGPVWLKP